MPPTQWADERCRYDEHIRDVIVLCRTLDMPPVLAHFELLAIKLFDELSRKVDGDVVVFRAHRWLLAQLSTMQLPTPLRVLQGDLLEGLLAHWHDALPDMMVLGLLYRAPGGLKPVEPPRVV